MGWFRIDDKSAFHSKVLKAGNAAWGALCRMGAWSKDHLTDGLIPKSVVEVIATPEEVATLQANGLLDGASDQHGGVDNFWIHDFLDWNESAEKERKRRRERQKAGRNGGFTSASKRQAKSKQLLEQTPSKTVANSNPVPVPVPVPVVPSGDKSPTGIPPIPPLEANNDVQPVPLTSEQRYQRAYGDGIQIATGNPFMFPRKMHEAGILNELTATYFQGKRGEELTKAITWKASEFARWVMAHPEEAKFFPGLSPSGFARWLNDEFKRKPQPKAKPKYDPTEWTAEDQRAYEAEKARADARMPSGASLGTGTVTGTAGPPKIDPGANGAIPGNLMKLARVG